MVENIHTGHNKNRFICRVLRFVTFEMSKKTSDANGGGSSMSVWYKSLKSACEKEWYKKLRLSVTVT